MYISVCVGRREVPIASCPQWEGSLGSSCLERYSERHRIALHLMLTHALTLCALVHVPVQTSNNGTDGYMYI